MEQIKQETHEQPHAKHPLQAETAIPDGPFSLYIGSISRGNRGNPGDAVIWAVLCDSTGVAVEVLCRDISVVTADEAKHEACIDGLLLAMRHGVTRLRIYTDSTFFERQLNENWEVQADLLPLYRRRVQGLRKEFLDFEAVWISPEKSVQAFARANQARNQAAARGEAAG